MRRYWIARRLAMLLAMAPAPLLAAVDSQAGRYYEDALARYEKRDLPGAIIQLKNALQQDRTMLSAQLLLGKALLANGEVAAAEVALTEALRLGVNRSELVLPLARALIEQGKPQNVLDGRDFAPDGLPNPVRAQLLLMRAGAYADVGETVAAQRAIAEARALDAASPDSWLAEVPIRLRVNALDEATTAVEHALKLAPASATAWELKASVLHQRGELAGALAAYDRALELSPEQSGARIARAGIYLDLNRDADARRDIDELTRRAPRDPRVAYLRAQVAERAGDRKAAQAALRELTALIDPVPMDFIRYRSQLLVLGGLAHYTLGEPAKATPYLKTLIKVHGPSPASKLLAQIHLVDGDARDAADVLEAYLRKRPGDPQAMMLMASVQLAQGRNDKATALMEEALKLKDTPEYRTLFGMGLLQSGRGADALEALEAAFRKNSGLTRAGVPLIGLYLRGGQPAKAVTTADALVRKHPNSAPHWNMLGIARVGAKDFAGARKAFDKALTLDAGQLSADLNLVRLDVIEKNPAAAETRLARLLKAHDRNLDVLLLSAQVHEFRGRTAEAQRQLEQARDLEGAKQYRAALELHAFYVRQRHPERALDAIKGALAKAPEDFALLLTYAQAQLAVGDAASARPALNNAGRVAAFDAARQVAVARLQMLADDFSGARYALDKALIGRPDDLTAQALMAEVEVRLGEPAKAERRARELIERQPRRAIGYLVQGDVAAGRGDAARAVESYRKAHQAEPSTATLLKLYAALEGDGDGRGATTLAEQWLKAQPGDLLVRRALADGYARAQAFAKARSMYEAILQRAPEDVEVINNLANVLIRQQQPAAAVPLAERALTVAPGRAAVIDTLGWALHLSGQGERALATLRDARLREPNDAEIRYHLAVALEQSGRRDEARQELESALALGRAFESRDEATKLLGKLR